MTFLQTFMEHFQTANDYSSTLLMFLQFLNHQTTGQSNTTTDSLTCPGAPGWGYPGWPGGGIPGWPGGGIPGWPGTWGGAIPGWPGIPGCWYPGAPPG